MNAIKILVNHEDRFEGTYKRRLIVAFATPSGWTWQLIVDGVQMFFFTKLDAMDYAIDIIDTLDKAKFAPNFLEHQMMQGTRFWRRMRRMADHRLCKEHGVKKNWVAYFRKLNEDCLKAYELGAFRSEGDIKVYYPIRIMNHDIQDGYGLIWAYNDELTTKYSSQVSSQSQIWFSERVTVKSNHFVDGKWELDTLGSDLIPQVVQAINNDKAKFCLTEKGWRFCIELEQMVILFNELKTHHNS